MLCRSRALAGAGVASFAVACAGAPIEAETPADVPYVHPSVSARLDVRVVDLDSRNDLAPLDIAPDLTDDEVAQLVDPARAREARFATALGGLRRPTLDCFGPGHPAADVWVVGRTGNGGAIRAVELARSTASPEATECVKRVLLGARGRGPAAHVGFSYLLHVEPWPEGCTTVDCEQLPPLPRVEEQAPIGVSTAYVDLSNSTMDRFRAGLRSCYSRALSQDPNLQGRLTLRARIGESGEVASVDASSTSAALTSVAACARARFASLVFPPPQFAPVEMVVPLVFTTPSAEPPAPAAPSQRVLDGLDGPGFAALASSKGAHAAAIPIEHPDDAWMVFVEQGGRVATVRRAGRDAPVRKDRTRHDDPSGGALLLDDPDGAFDDDLFRQLER